MVSQNKNQTGKPYAVTVMFEVSPASYLEFVELVKVNAHNSVELEPNCFIFDVLTPATSGALSKVFLYEVYKDRSAFDYHCASPHFQSFDVATKPMVLQKTVLDYVVDEFRKA